MSEMDIQQACETLRRAKWRDQDGWYVIPILPPARSLIQSGGISIDGEDAVAIARSIQLEQELARVTAELADERGKNLNLQATLRLHENPGKVVVDPQYYDELQSEHERVTAERDELRKACEIGLRVIDGLADQQASGDDWYLADRQRIEQALATATLGGSVERPPIEEEG